MKKGLRIVLAVMITGWIASASQTASAQVSAGAGVAFGSEIEQVGIQADLHYRLANVPAVRLGGGFVYYFPKNNRNFYELNLNGAYIFYEEFMFKSYGYAGVNYSRSSVSSGGNSVSDSAVGLNLGVGAEYDLGPLLAFADLKYIVSELDQPVFAIGIRVPF